MTGDFGEKPKVRFPTPLAPEETQCTEIIAGDGERLQEGQVVLLGASIFNGTTGELVQSIGYDDDPASLPIGGNTLIAFTKGLSCAREGSRVVVVAPSEEAIKPADNPSGTEGGDSLVAVFDVQRAFPARADGAVRLSRDGFPAVVLAPDGRPGITVPNADPFETTEVEVLKEGSGQVVESGDTVVVHYTGVTWAESDMLEDSTWPKGSPTIVTVTDGEGGQMPAGFSEAVIGQKVGSQVAVVVPPSAGFGDQGNATVPPGATLFYVIDILGVI
ncbi:FKBP-type peptidyl-prolyl cis-trans isomerase [Agromyces sp. NPDC056389]|uniref:FKBP-type peptidyl-prolyl cis-trans isomerase n=1 Tax=Agromyces sp. NPDC056389 TaxID=3345805 RepID=UPI0035E20E9D